MSHIGFILRIIFFLAGRGIKVIPKKRFLGWGGGKRELCNEPRLVLILYCSSGKVSSNINLIELPYRDNRPDPYKRSLITYCYDICSSQCTPLACSKYILSPQFSAAMGSKAIEFAKSIKNRFRFSKFIQWPGFVVCCARLIGAAARRDWRGGGGRSE